MYTERLGELKARADFQTTHFFGRSYACAECGLKITPTSRFFLAWQHCDWTGLAAGFLETRAAADLGGSEAESAHSQRRL